MKTKANPQMGVIGGGGYRGGGTTVTLNLVLDIFTCL